MYSVIDISGKQYSVKEGDVLAIDLIEDKKKDDKLEFDKIVLVKSGEKDAKVGTPFVKGASVQASVIDHVKDEKVITFKYKKRKNSKRIRGHRQPYTLIKINKISFGD